MRTMGHRNTCIILFESMALNKLSIQQLHSLLEAPQVQSLRIVMNAVSALFRSEEHTSELQSR